MVQFDPMWGNAAGTLVVAVIIFWLVQGSFEALLLGAALFLALAWHGFGWAGW